MILKNKKGFILIFLLYGICSTIFALDYRYTINPDGIAQIRLAGYIAEGHFMRSVTQCWSPLFIWLMSPFRYIGLDGLTTARIVIALSGAGFLFSTWFFIRRFQLSEGLALLSLLISALLISYFSVQNIGADIPLAAILLFYMYLVTHPHILGNKRLPFLSGIVGGLSYLAHHYAFPFFVVHYPVTLIVRKYIATEQAWNKYLKSLIMGFLGFILVSSIWIGITTKKYGVLTFSYKGTVMNAAIAPKGTGHPYFKGGLFKPRDPYALHVFEDPSEVKLTSWSPFENKEYFLHQIAIIRMNIDYIFKHFIRSSPFFTYPFMVGVLSLIPIILLMAQMDREERFIYSWIVVTFLIYCSGFVLTLARSPRRFYVLMIIVVIFAFDLFSRLIKLFDRKLQEPRKKILIAYLLLIITPAFSLKPFVHLVKSLKNIITIEYVNPYKDIADQINQVDFPAPMAFIRSSQKGYTDLYLAYFINKQFLGRPRSRDIEGITNELRAVGCRSLLVFDNLGIVDKLKRDGRYLHLARIKLKKDERYWNFPRIKHDEITAWDREVNIFVLVER